MGELSDGAIKIKLVKWLLVMLKVKRVLESLQKMNTLTMTRNPALLKLMVGKHDLFFS